MTKLKTKIEPDEKVYKISQSMCKFNELLNMTTKDLDSNLNKIEQLQEAHLNFVNFVKTVNLYESYKWINIKYDYNFIKNKINKDKKIIHVITKFFGSITNYYTLIEIHNINIKINDISCKIELMIYKFNKLQILHNQVHNKSKYMIRNNSVIKINNFNNINKHLLLKIYENYNSIKIVNIKIKNLKNIKKYLGREIFSIQSNLVK